MGRSRYSVLFFSLCCILYAEAVSSTPAHRSKFLDCGSYKLPPGEYWIASPRCMKESYNCQYSIKVSPKNNISITCPRFSSSSRWCRQNHLQIHDWKYCGRNTPKDISRRGELKIIAFSRGHPAKMKFLCQIVVSLRQNVVSTSIPVTSTSISTATTALTQAPTTVASKSTVSAAVPPSSPTTVPQTTAAPTTIVPETSTSYTTVSSTANPSSTTVQETTATPTTIVAETSTSEITLNPTAAPSSTTVPDTTTVSTTTSPCQPQPPAKVQCGRANHIRKVRLLGGEETEKYEFPWLAAVVGTGEPKPKCSATILNSLYLITGKYCLSEGISQYKIQLRKHFTSVDEQQIEVKIESEITHPDISLLKLRTPIEFPSDNFIAPICLPPEDRTDYAGAQAITVGWGLTVIETATHPSVWSEALMKLSVTIAPDEDCRTQSQFEPINPAQEMCAKPVYGKGACAYDFGNPLIIAGTGDTYSIIGVIKYISCGYSNSKDVYTRITPLLPWIRAKIADGDFCTN